MPYLQFLNGSRDQEFEELRVDASLVLGSGPEAHITLKDPGIEGKHITVYPAQGSFWLQDMGTGATIKNMKRLANATDQLGDCDLFIIGQTFVKFWNEKPAGAKDGGGGGGGGGADPAALAAAEAAQRAAESERDELKLKLTAAEQQIAEQSSAGASELEAAKSALEAAEAKASSLTEELSTAEGKVSSLTQELSDLAGRVTELEGEVKTAQADAEAQIAEAKANAEREKEESEEALEATRAALEAIEGARAAGGHDNLQAARGRSDLAATLELLALPDPIQRRLEQAIAAEIDREALRRAEGPVVPLRGLRVPGLDRDLEGELRALKQHAERVASARELGLTELEPEELGRLLEMARQ